MVSSVPQEPVEFQIPKLPTESVKDFIPYISKYPDTPLDQLLAPFKAFESELRKIYAQQPTHVAVSVPNVNLVPIFDGHEKEVTVRARSLKTESEVERSHFIMPLKHGERKKSGSPALVSSFKEFQKNFNLFSESSLIDLDWDNVVAAGSSVTTSLLPVPEKWAGSKRSMRQYYHENLAPASDVDLFLYGMNEEQARQKIIQIEQRVKDSILHEVTTIRTKNAITIASQYPTRHIQIVLRLYDSVSQIITGFDVDCACLAYDGKQVHAAPRAIAAFMTQCNTIDLSRRSPSYENRLSKYSHRGFEVNWPMLDRTRIDPTIFERSFGRTQGLARLLILEKLPKAYDRDSYMAQRREERGRPALSRWRNQFNNSGNLKDQAEDEVSDWIEQEDVSSYHSMTVPYGPKYGAARITRLLYAKDLLLNAEWNQPKDREVYLHRHPCFFSGTSGTAEDILQDCCGYCPVPKTDEEIEVAEEEGKTNVSGALVFMKDDPGRQAIGSFNPITDDEWTTMAYVGDTARLCQAIVDHDIEHVQDWLQQEGVDVNRRDFVGRTPLHLATMTSTPEIVKLLIDNNARMIARLQDGRTALHIAAARGIAEMVKALMDKSLENEEEEEEKREARLEAKRAERNALGDSKTDDDGAAATDKTNDADDESSASEITLDSEDSDSMTMGSFVKVPTNKEIEDGVEESTEEPDIYEVDVIAWDYNLSPLHCAIINGHLEIIELLVSEYGADVLLPVKLIDLNSKNARGAIMSIILALFLPSQDAEKVVKLLLRLGASSAQGDMNQISAFHYLVSENKSDLLKILLEDDRPAALSVVNKVGFASHNNFMTPLLTAVERGYSEMVSDLLSIGAKPEVSFDEWIKVYLEKNPWSRNNTSENNMLAFRTQMKQPVIAAANLVSGNTVSMLLAAGADPATLDPSTYDLVLRESRYAYFNNSREGNALLDLIQKKLKELRDYDSTPTSLRKEPEILEEEAHYTHCLTEGSYQYWSVSKDYQVHKAVNQSQWKSYKKSKEEQEIPEGMTQKKAAIAEVIKELESTERTLIAAGAKPFDEMHHEIAAKARKNKNGGYQPYHSSAPANPKPFKSSIRFNVPDINDVKKTGYIRLFEAAWNGDLDTIKSLTLTPWITKMQPANSPLQIAIQDSNGFSPFSIAVLRGHLELARSIVSISMAQYHKDDNQNQRQRWMMRKDVDSDCEDSDDENILPIISELVDDEFTVDNLGEVSNVVKSRVMPSTMMGWSCKVKRFDDCMVKDSYSTLSGLLEQAVTTDNMDILKLIIELGAEQQALLAEEPDDRRCYSMDVSVFDLAIKLGRTAMIAEMIKSTGVGIPLNKFVQNSGVEEKSKPKYYQGLSVGGSKRADWAQAPNDHAYVGEYHNNPLLEAAFAGSIESVEWFMSDAPMRLYKEFAAKNKSDKRIKTLHESGKGFDQTVSTFLNAKSELLLHCAILSRPKRDIGTKSNAENNAKYMGLIKHILSVAPETLEQKSSKGYTPLQLAVLTNRKKVVSYLISVGANQRHRDRSGKNMIHSMLANVQHCRMHGPGLQGMIELFDDKSVKEMLLERTSQPQSSTPLAYWMLRNGTSFRKPDILEVLAKYSTGEDLSMINSEGDLPLHFAIKKGLTSIASFLLSQNSSLIYRENSTGRTPLEMSREIYHASCVKDPISLYTHHHQQHEIPNLNILSRSPTSFLPDTKEEEEPKDSKKRTFEICTQMDENIRAEGGDQKRRLVSLTEANEVAKRVSLRSRRGGMQAVVNGGLVGGEGVDDVVSLKMAGIMEWCKEY